MYMYRTEENKGKRIYKVYTKKYVFYMVITSLQKIQFSECSRLYTSVFFPFPRVDFQF